MTPYALAQRFVGEVKELPGNQDHPAIQWAHMLCGLGHSQPDEVPWCSSWLNLVAWLLGLPRSKSAAARSWLDVGTVIRLDAAVPGYDVVVLKRGTNPAQGHVGLFAGLHGGRLYLLGGNQGNTVSIAAFDVADVIGVRRLGEATR